jgi:hypothetical protein
MSLSVEMVGWGILHGESQSQQAPAQLFGGNCNSDYTGATCKSKILANTPELLLYVYIFYFFFFFKFNINKLICCRKQMSPV